MPTTKITDLTAYTDPVNTDVLPIVDVTSDVTKKVSIANMMKNASLGSAAAPGISFDGDPNTGIYSPGADQVAISTGGSQRLNIDANGRLNVAANSQGIRFGTQANISAAEGAELILNNLGAQPIAFYTNNSERLRITSDGKVGVGTSSPSGRLHVIADAITTGAGLQTWGYDVNQPNYQLRLRTDVSAGVVKYNFNLLNQGTEYDANLVLDRGRLGVGTTSPNQSLHVNGIIQAESSGNYLQLQQATNDSYINNTGSGGIIFRQGTGFTERARIDSSGRVGIGTSSPGRTFHVSGTTDTPAQFQTSQANLYINLVNSSASNGYIGFEGTNLSLWNGGANRLNIDSSGRVGIGTTSPAQLLHISGSGNAFARIDGGSTSTAGILFNNGDGAIYYDNTNDFLRFDTLGAEKARIDSSGRLLVGTSTSTSSALLRVQGRVGALTDNAQLSLGRGSSVSAADQALGLLLFTDSSENNGAYIYAQAEAAWTSGSSHPSRLIFSTTASGASSPTERMRISNNGVVTIKNGAVAEIGTLTDAATITPNFASNCNFTVTLGGARTIANPTNVTAGQSGSIFIVQDGTGGRTASWGSNWDWAGGTAPTLSTGANAVDRVDYICRSATSIHAVYTGNYS